MAGYLSVVIYLGMIVAFAIVSLAVFLFPWVLALRGLGIWGVGTMVIFLAILSLGWFYAYRERILEWQ